MTENEGRLQKQLGIALGALETLADFDDAPTARQALEDITRVGMEAIALQEIDANTLTPSPDDADISNGERQAMDRVQQIKARHAPADAVGAEGGEEVDRVAWAIGQALIAAWRETDLEAGKALTGEDIRICARAAIAALRAQPVEHDALAGLRSEVFAILRRHDVSEQCFAEVAMVTHAALSRQPGEADGWRLREALGEICRDSNPDWTEKRAYPNDVLDDIHKLATEAYFARPAEPTRAEKAEALLRECRDWMKQCSDWLLSTDLDMQCPMETDPLDITDRIDAALSTGAEQ